MTHPAGWRENRLEVLREAARRAGVGDVDLLDKSEAARRTGRWRDPDSGQAGTVACYDSPEGTYVAITWTNEDRPILGQIGGPIKTRSGLGSAPEQRKALFEAWQSAR